MGEWQPTTSGTTSVGTVPLCGFCGRPVRGEDLTLLNGSPIPYHIACTYPPGPAPMSHGCICPPRSEETCQGLACPRRAWGIPR